MRHASTLLLLVLCASQAPADPHPEWDSRALVHVLSDEDPRVRDVAAHELEGRGEAVVPVLEEALLSHALDPEASAVIREMLDRLAAQHLSAGRYVLRTSVGSGAAMAMAFSRDGEKFAAVGKSGDLVIWETRTGRKLGQCLLPCGESWDFRVRFDADGARVAVDCRLTVVVCDIRDPGSISTISSQPDTPSYCADARFEACFRKPGTAALIRPPENDTEYHLSPSGTHALWRERGFYYFATPENPDGGAGAEDSIPEWWRSALAIDDSGRVFSCDGTALLFDGRVLAGHCRSCPAVSPLVDVAATLSPLGRLSVWRTDGSEAWSCRPEGDADLLAVSPGGTTVAISSRSAGIRLVTRDSVKPLDGLGAIFESLAFSPDGKFLAGAGPRSVFIEVATGESHTVDAAASFATNLGREDGIVLLENGSPALWSARSHVRTEFLEALSSGEWHDISFSPDGRHVAGRVEERLLGLSDLGGEISHPESRWNFASAWSPDSRRLVTSQGLGNSDLCIRDIEGKELATFDAPGIPDFIDWSPDGESIACGGRGDIVITRAADTSSQVSLDTQVAWLSFLDDARLLTLDRNSRRILILRRASDLRPIQTNILPLERVTAIALDRKHCRLAVAGAGEILVLDLSSAAK